MKVHPEDAMKQLVSIKGRAGKNAGSLLTNPLNSATKLTKEGENENYFFFFEVNLLIVN